MPGLVPRVDPNGLLEYSVVFTDRALNHMSGRFQQVMLDLSRQLKAVYQAHSVAIVPGGGTYAMEAVARQLGGMGAALVLRNGWFSFRWTQIFETMGAAAPAVLLARPTREGPQAPFAPAPIAEVVAHIENTRPAVVFAAHVETASGMVLPDAYLDAVSAAAHGVGALFVLDCIASGALWVDMKARGVDVLLTAPQKGWSGPAGAGVVLMSEQATARLDTTSSTSFALDLKRWRGIMAAYESGGHAYHATMPTDALTAFRDAIAETEALGFEAAREAQVELGWKVRAVLAAYGCPSVAAEGFEASGVVVSYLPRAGFSAGPALAAHGVQVAGGVPLRCGEPADFATFRVGLFGLDKLRDVDGTVARLEAALAGAVGHPAALG